MKDVLTTGQVAKLCNVTIRTVIKWFEKGHLEGYRIPGSRDRRFPLDNVVAFMKEHGMPLGELERQLSPRKKILLVDDDEALLLVLEEYLDGIGIFEIEVARNGYEAGLKTHSFRPHLLVLDFNLGDITGAEVASSVRSSEDLAGMQILVMSGYLSDAQAAELMQRGVDDFLRKPFQMEALRDKVLELLGVT